MLGHWSKPVTWLATVACIRESLTHACNSNMVINLPKEGWRTYLARLREMVPTTGNSACCSRRRRNFSRLKSRWTLASIARSGKELLGLVQLRGEGEDDVDGDGGLPDYCCFLLHLCFSMSSRVLLSCVVACAIIGRRRQWSMVMEVWTEGGDKGSSPVFFCCYSSLTSPFPHFLLCPSSPFFFPAVSPHSLSFFLQSSLAFSCPPLLVCCTGVAETLSWWSRFSTATSSAKEMKGRWLTKETC